MNGIKEKKLLLEISQENFIEKMLFLSEEEKSSCINYLKLKGVAYHVVLANYIGLDSNGKIEYRKIATLYKYDKRIRNILYKYLSAFEEGVRGFITNKYSSNKTKMRRLSIRIFKLINKGSSLAKELENLKFSELMNLAKRLRVLEQRELFGIIENLVVNLDAIRELRNAVSHHRQLFVYDDLNECIVNGHENISLIANIKNLYNLLPDFYKDFFKRDINNSCEDGELADFKDLIPDETILHF